MALVFLQATCHNSSPSSFARSETYWNTVTRSEESQTDNVQACQTFALAVGAQVDQWCDLDSTQTTIYYKGGADYDPARPNGPLTGRTRIAQAAACPVPTALTLDFPSITPAGGTPTGAARFRYYTPQPPVNATLNGLAAYGANSSGTLEFLNLAAGTYRLRVQDAAGTVREQDVPVPGLDAYGPALLVAFGDYDNPSNPDSTARYVTARGVRWDRKNKRVIAFYYDPPSLDLAGYGLPPYSVQDYAKPLNELVDAYYLPGGQVYRRVYHRDDTGDGIGDGQVRFEDTVLSTAPPIGGLRFENIITQHIHQAATDESVGLGAVLLEARSTALKTQRVGFPASGGTAGIRYERVATGEENRTGQFGGLPAGPHPFRARDEAGNVAEETVLIEDRYRLRWFLAAVSLEGLPVRVDLLGRDYRGPATALTGAGADCLERTWDAAGQDIEGVLPEASGQRCQLRVLQDEADQFADVYTGPAADDRAFRLDVHVAGLLVFRGYVLPDLYDQDLSLASGGVVTLTAGDGLGGLRSTSFLNHVARPLTRRQPLLHTLLHCLSRCECGPLPLYAQVGLREVNQPAGTDWLATFASDRGGYGEEPDGARPKAWDCRAVIDALLRPAYAVLVQRAGAWWVVSATAAGTAAPFFAYAPNGAPLPAPAVEFPDLRILPPTERVTPLLDACWLLASQRAQTLAPARAGRASTHLRLVANQLDDGRLQRWQPDLRHPIGWTGDLDVDRLPLTAGEDAQPVAGVSKLRINGQQPAGADQARLQSPPLQFQGFTEESPVRVAVRLRVRPGPAEAPVRARVRVRPYILTSPLPTLLSWEVSSAEKEVTVEAFVGFGEATVAAGALSLALLAPRVLLADGSPGPEVAAVDVYEVIFQVLPGAVQWPATDEVTSLSETGFVVLPAVELHHADAPRLPLLDGTLRPAAPAMDVSAWRHALSYADDDRPTVRWQRPGSLASAALLETAALDRLDQRRAPVSLFTGPVRGVGAAAGLGFGAVVEVVDDAPDVRFWCVGARVRDLQGEADVTLREIGLLVPRLIPDFALITHAGAAFQDEAGAYLVWG